MKNISIFIIIVLASLSLGAQEIRLSAISDADKKAAIKISSGILNGISRHDYESIRPFFVSHEANFGGSLWMPARDFVSFIRSITGKDYLFSNIRAYGFDDCRNDPVILGYARQLYRVFNNFSIMVIADAKEKNTGKQTHLGFIFCQNNKKTWEAYSVFGLDANMIIIPDRGKLKDYRFIRIKEGYLEIPIHKSFRHIKNTDTDYNYFMKGSTKRDAAIQVISFPKKDDLLSASRGWVMHNLEKKQSTDPEVKYFLDGYWYECIMKGQDKIPIKMIVIALESNDEYIFINFFSYLDCYIEKYSIFYEGLTNIKFIK